MRVLLAYPEFPETFWSFSHALWFVGKKAVSPPLGLLTVAAMLPEHWEKRLVDLNASPLREEDLAWADYVFISAMGIQRPGAEALVQRCHAAGKKIVAGGPLFTLDRALFDEVDHFILNEAELTLPPFLADLAHGTAKRIYETADYADLASSPVPQWNLVNWKHYTTVSVQASRGCPFACDFCSVTAMLGRKPRGKSGLQMVVELNALRGAGWRGPVFFVDDNLIGRRAEVKRDLLPSLIQWQKTHGPVPLLTQVSIDLADDAALIEQMCRAGFDTLFVGIETPDSQSLAECGKRQNRNRDVAADVHLLQRSGLEVQGGFIVGFDHDTPAIFQRQVEFVQQTGIATAMVGLLQAPAGTQLYHRLKAQNRLRGDFDGDNAGGSTNIIPAMGLETLLSGYEQLLKSLYSPGPYYRRIRTFLREYQLPRVRTPLEWNRIHAFARTLLHLGVMGQERWEYWRLLAWTLLRRPTMFPTAVRLAICGHHYMHMCQRMFASRLAPSSASAGEMA